MLRWKFFFFVFNWKVFRYFEMFILLFISLFLKWFFFKWSVIVILNIFLVLLWFMIKGVEYLEFFFKFWEKINVLLLFFSWIEIDLCFVWNFVIFVFIIWIWYFVFFGRGMLSNFICGVLGFGGFFLYIVFVLFKL